MFPGKPQRKIVTSKSFDSATPDARSHLGVFRTETEFTRWLGRRAPNRARGLSLGIGDDAALVRLSPGHDLILTTDLSIEGVHFSRALHPPRAVGHRALARSLSDVAAMGGTPRYALISLALSRLTSRAWIEDFYAGVVALAKQFAVAVVGGDTAVVPGAITIDVMVAGEAPRGKAIRRSGARPGDQLFVSGGLGLSALGLRSLRATAGRVHHRKKTLLTVPAGEKMTAAVQTHLYPEPRCPLGRFLAEQQLASSLIDLSDGLSTDLARLCEASGVGAALWADCIPAPKRVAAELSAADALSLALHGGEDYELLFSVSPLKAGRVPRRFQGVPLHRIGEITRSKKIIRLLSSGEKVSLKPAGYDHFAR